MMYTVYGKPVYHVNGYKNGKLEIYWNFRTNMSKQFFFFILFELTICWVVVGGGGGAEGVEAPRCWGGVEVVERGRGPYEGRGLENVWRSTGRRVEINNP